MSVALTGVTSSAPTDAALRVRHDLGHRVVVGHGDVDLVTYVYGPDDVQLESPRPYLHPVRTLGGELMTLFRPHDHVWHKGIALSLPNVGRHNFWGGPTFVRDEGYVQLANNGSMDHVRFTQLEVSGDAARLAHELAWHTQPDGPDGGAEVVRETRRITATVPPDDGSRAASTAWVLTLESSLTNVSDEALDIGSPTTNGRENAGYGGLFWRGPRAFTGGTILWPGQAGGEEARGTRAEWMGFTGRHDGSGESSSLVVVDDGANPHHPPEWFVRNEWFAGVNPAPFFSEEVPFPPGGTLDLRYAVVIADGAADPVRAEALAGFGRTALAGLDAAEPEGVARG
ncbi:PmoA family protein [Georgenia sp. M64]|uniref:DUF6807 domain-containing protein n=1 Tax=Georgenia sp. M64 TaxID=3120520 RepID=UPI0030DE11DA